MEKFNADIANSSLLISPASDLNDLVQQYDRVLSSVLDSHAPCADLISMISVYTSKPSLSLEQIHKAL